MERQSPSLLVPLFDTRCQYRKQNSPCLTHIKGQRELQFCRVVYCVIFKRLRLMDNLAVYASYQKLVLGNTANPRTEGIISNKPLFCLFKTRKRSGRLSKSTTSISALSQPQGSTPRTISKSNEIERLGKDCFARLASSSNQHTSSVGANRQIAVPPHLLKGSPLFWVGVGVALSALFSWKYAMQQAFKTMMGQVDSQNNQFSNLPFHLDCLFHFQHP